MPLSRLGSPDGRVGVAHWGPWNSTSTLLAFWNAWRVPNRAFRADPRCSRRDCFSSFARPSCTSIRSETHHREHPELGSTLARVAGVWRSSLKTDRKRIILMRDFVRIERAMKDDQTKDAKVPDQKELEKELNEYLGKKYGDRVKLVVPMLFPRADRDKTGKDHKAKAEKETPATHFDLKPEQLQAYLDEFVIKQDEAKEVLATKVCTHFNRIKFQEFSKRKTQKEVGRIKSNIIMIGPTGVGKTYLIKLIANRIGVPFVKGDATKFSETGYVGGDVEDLIRDLVHEADGDIKRADSWTPSARSLFWKPSNSTGRQGNGARRRSTPVTFCLS